MRSLRQRSTVVFHALVCTVLVAGCGGAQPAPAPTAPALKPAVSASASAAPAAPVAEPLLLQPWSGPHGGVPPFGKFAVTELKQGLEAGIADQLARVERIAADPSPPTFENTIAGLERASLPMQRATTIYEIYTSAMSDDAVQAIEREMGPKLAAKDDAIIQNAKLFKRIAAIYEARATSGLTPEQQRLAWFHYTNFVRSGAKLDDAAKKKLSELNHRLAELYPKFKQNVLAEESGQMVVLESEADLEGLPPSLRSAAANAASNRGKPGKWAVLNTRSSVDPFLAWSARREQREKVWRMYKSRGDNRDARDNNDIIVEILKLRAQRAKLLGYATHAHWQLEQSMAKTPERAMTLMEQVWKPAVARVREEVKDMQKIADKERVRIEPWDYLFYAEKVRKAKYDLDQNEVKPYLQLEKLREGLFFVAGELFGLKFEPITDGSAPGYHPDVRV
jgi:peptidyl-dipeptidase Dcp